MRQGRLRMMSQPDSFSNTQRAGDVFFPSLTKSLGTIFLSYQHRTLKLEEKDHWGISRVSISSPFKKTLQNVFFFFFKFYTWMIAFNSLFHKLLFSRWAMTALILTYDCRWDIKPYRFEIQDQLQIGYSAYFEKAWFYSSGHKVIAASQHSFFLFFFLVDGVLQISFLIFTTPELLNALCWLTN